MINEKTSQQIENNFKYHAVNQSQIEQQNSIRLMCKNLAHKINKECPESREKSLSLTHLEEVMFFANSAISRYPQNQT